MTESPLFWGPIAVALGFGVAAWILRWEFRHQLRKRRHGGFLIGGDQ